MIAAARHVPSAPPLSLPVYLHFCKIVPEVAKSAPKDTIWIDVSDSPLAYFESLRAIWELREGFVLLEHDIVCRPDIIEAFESCEHPWCTFVYDNLCHPECREAYQNQLGCTRFTSEIVRAVPWAFDMPEPERLWQRVNEGLGADLRAAGFGHHWHEPAVEHLHK